MAKMAILQLYRNPYSYPDYGSIETVGSSVECTPKGIGYKTGTIHVASRISNFHNCNYLSITRNNQTIYAWIEDVEVQTDNSYIISYRVDPWRTYRSKISLGTQFVARSSTPTYKKDDLLGTSRAYADVETINIPWSNSNSRVFVVQVRPTGAEISSSTPVQPSPYQFFMTPYGVNSWKDNQALNTLMTTLMEAGETENIVTMYSIPFMDTTSLPSMALPVRTPTTTIPIEGFRFLGDVSSPNQLLRRERSIDLGSVNVDELMRVDHTVQLVIPDSGIINIPTELLKQNDLKLRQDVDLFSGASNYMLMSGEGTYYTHSVRGSAISSIPVLSDPMDTYLSQNQNALATSLIGDVASIAIGAGMIGYSGGVGATVGASQIVSGVNGLISTRNSVLDSGNRYSNPPAFLGTALAGAFNNRFWVVITKENVDNATLVHNNFGYPLEKITNLSFPNSGGYVKTEGCNVSSDGTVPRWAIEEINTMFNNGIAVH